MQQFLSMLVSLRAKDQVACCLVCAIDQHPCATTTTAQAKTGVSLCLLQAHLGAFFAAVSSRL